MVPGAYGIMGGESGHYPRFCGVITQPPLPSYDRRVPDFMWLARDSNTDQSVLIEIEAPSKRWFTKSGAPTAALTQALHQINEWKAWFDVPRNVESFKDFYRFESGWHSRRFQPSFLLIYGRRAEANANPRNVQQRAHMFSENVFGCTFDRLHPNPKAEPLVCLKSVRPGDFEVVSVPATLRWRPGLAHERALVSGWDTAIHHNSHISTRRKEFLVRRRVYWEEWVNRNTSGYIVADGEE